MEHSAPSGLSVSWFGDGFLTLFLVSAEPNGELL